MSTQTIPVSESMRPPASQMHIAPIAITAAIVAGPFVALAVLAPLLWGSFLNVADIVLAVVMYVFTGLGVTVGFHRLFTHGGFRPNRPLKILIAIAGSMAIEGSLVSWVATHRRHHMFSDQPGDPHSPHKYGPGAANMMRGLLFAHMGWLFVADTTSADRYAPDMSRDPDLLLVSRLFPALAVCSLAIPFGLGYLLTGTLTGAIVAFCWAGLVRMALLHHVTWSINSLCHVFGRQPYDTKDFSTNIAALASVSFGESWHNTHHAHPAWARHGAGRGQLDPSARVIRIFEKLGWATKVRWPILAESFSAIGD